MLASSLLPQRPEPYRLLVLGAHPDDIEIGCGATLLRMLDEQPTAMIRWVVFTGDGPRAEEARASAVALLPPDRLQLSLFGFRDRFLPWDGAQVKAAFDRIAASFSPDIVFSPRLEDAHQDHRLIAELTWQTFRGTLICEYEIPKWEGDLGGPNLFVQVSEDLAHRKVAHLEKHFPSQRERAWFSADAFLAMLRLRGIEGASPSGYAEAFTCRKLLV